MSSSKDSESKPSDDQIPSVVSKSGQNQISKKQSFLTGYLRKALFTLAVFALLGSALLMFATWLISNTILSALPK